MRIYFYAGKCAPVHAHILAERPLGGTETGLVRLAAALHQRGHDVVVFTSHQNPPAVEQQPSYVPVSQLMTAPPCDVLVAVQDWWGLMARVAAKKRCFWTGDAGDQYLTYGIGDKRIAGRIDQLICVSQWQAQHLAGVSGYPLEKTVVIQNGVHLPWFSGSQDRVKKRLIHTPSPYRGLELLPEIVRRLRAEDSEIELHIYSGLEVYARSGKFAGPEADRFAQLKQVILQTPGCIVHENIPQAELAKEFQKASLFVYPCIFPETSCISAIEAMAAGCPSVATAFAALPETIADAGVFVKADPRSEQHCALFVAAVQQLLSDEALWQQYSKAALTRAQTEYSWEHVCDRFEQRVLC